MTIHYFYQMPVYETPNSTNYLLNMPLSCSDSSNQGRVLTIPPVVPPLVTPFTNSRPISPILSTVSVPPAMMTPVPIPAPLVARLTLPTGPAVFQPTPSPSPTFGPIPDLLSNTPSPVFAPIQEPCMVQNAQPDLSQCQVLYELSIIKHQATVHSISQNYAGEIADAMRNVLQTDVWYLFVVVTLSDKSMTIQWCVHEFFFEFLVKKTLIKDFDKRLICELAHVGNGEFNKHLHGSKQLAIINEGYACFHRLREALESHNEAKDRLFNSCIEDKFDEENVQDLFRVCEAPRGMALRGKNVVGGHFRGGDVLKLNQFLDVIEATTGEKISKATMIPSMKGKAQYKGWSIYVETPSAEYVERIKEACETCSFEKAGIFTAVDKFQR